MEIQRSQWEGFEDDYDGDEGYIQLKKINMIFRRLLGLWIIGLSITLIIGYFLSQQMRMQWYPIGGIYNFFYILIIGFCILLFRTIASIRIQFKWKFIVTLFIWTIIYSLIFGIIFPEEITSWSGSLENRPPNLYNFQLSLKISLIGSCIIGVITGIFLRSKSQ